MFTTVKNGLLSLPRRRLRRNRLSDLLCKYNPKGWCCLQVVNITALSLLLPCPWYCLAFLPCLCYCIEPVTTVLSTLLSAYFIASSLYCPVHFTGLLVLLPPFLFPCVRYCFVLGYCYCLVTLSTVLVCGGWGWVSTTVCAWIVCVWEGKRESVCFSVCVCVCVCVY